MWPAPWFVRILLIAEVLLWVGVFIAYALYALPTRDVIHWYNIAFVAFAVGFPIGMNLLHGDRPRDSGMRVDNLLAAARETGVFTLAAGVAIVVVGLIFGGPFWSDWSKYSWPRFGDKVLTYLAWGPFQQYVLQAFAIRRFRQAGIPDAAAVLGGAALFALAHCPNWPLVGLTFGAGVIWGRLFLRNPNLWVVGLSHGILAVLLAHAWPREWLNYMTIGGLYRS